MPIIKKLTNIVVLKMSRMTLTCSFVFRTPASMRRGPAVSGKTEEYRGGPADHQAGQRTRIPVTPCSSECTFTERYSQAGGIVMDLRRMNKILEFDLCNKMVRVEPG